MRSYKLTMQNTTEAPVELATAASDSELSRLVNLICKGLTIAKFMGCVIFTIFQNDVMYMAAVVTFTEDIPEGIWTVTKA
jgi:hypothetical protein